MRFVSRILRYVVALRVVNYARVCLDEATGFVDQERMVWISSFPLN